MTSLPNITGTGGVNDNDTNQGQQKTNLANLIKSVAEMPGSSESVTLEIDTGNIQPAAGASGTIRIETEGGASADDLATINATNLRDGAILLLQLEDSSHVVTIKNGTGANKIRTNTGADIVLKDKMFVEVQFDADLGSGEWQVINIFYADQTADFRTYLGLGTAATKTTGTSGGNVPLVSDGNSLWATIKLPGAQASSELTIASGVVTPTRGQHSVDTESDASTDNLDEMAVTNIADGGHVLLFAEHTDRTVVIRHNQGGTTNPFKTFDGQSISIDNTEKAVLFRRSGSNWIEVYRSGFSAASISLPGLCGFRLTGSTGNPLPSSDVTGITTMYLSPYSKNGPGGLLALYDGSSNWNLYSSSELSIAVPASVFRIYDVFVYDNSGTPALELTAWDSGGQVSYSASAATAANPCVVTIGSHSLNVGDIVACAGFDNTVGTDSSRGINGKICYVSAADATTITLEGMDTSSLAASTTGTIYKLPISRTTNLALQNGVYVKSGSTTRRYVGSFMTGATSGETEDSYARRYIYSACNEENRLSKALEDTDNWTYSTAAWRYSNNNSTLGKTRIQFLIGLQKNIPIEYIRSFSTSGASGSVVSGIVVDNGAFSSPTPIKLQENTVYMGDANVYFTTSLITLGLGIGPHFVQAGEFGIGSGTQTWYGDGGATGTRVFNGLQATIQG
jgi:hypothetical protein